MKKIIYLYHNNEVEMDWSEANEVIAAKEADNGIYKITPDDGVEKTVDPT